jgi:hypothetical protein
MITIKMKDAVLNALCENLRPESYNQASFIEFQKLIPDISFQELDAILTQFQRKGLISDLNSRPINIAFILLLDAFDFQQRGGFTIQEELFQSAYNKLQLEIESLQKESPEKAERFWSILSSFATIGAAMGSFFKK